MSQNVKIGKVSCDRIRQLREHGKAINYIANKYAFPISVINRICDGIDVEYFIRKPKREHRKPKPGLCECCNLRPKKEGFRKLCDFCWSNEDQDVEYRVGMVSL